MNKNKTHKILNYYKWIIIAIVMFMACIELSAQYFPTVPKYTPPKIPDFHQQHMMHMHHYNYSYWSKPRYKFQDGILFTKNGEQKEGKIKMKKFKLIFKDYITN